MSKQYQLMFCSSKFKLEQDKAIRPRALIPHYPHQMMALPLSLSSINKKIENRDNLKSTFV